MTRKFRDYFSLPSVQHSLVIHHDRPPLMLHRRREGVGSIRTSFLANGRLQL